MNINEMKIGQVFKNYRELCKFLGLDDTGGNTKIKNLKEISRFFEYDKKGNSFIITMIYEFPKPPIENIRGTTAHVQYGEILLMQLLLSQREKTLTISNSDLARRLNMIHSDFTDYYTSRVKLGAMLNVEIDIIHEFMEAINGAYKNANESIIRRLKRKMAIVYEDRVQIKIREYDDEKEEFKTVYRFATEKEKEEIARIKYEILRDNYKGNLDFVRATGKMSEYYSLIDAQTKKEYGIYMSYNVHVISFNHSAIEDIYLKQMNLLDKMSLEEIVELKSKINESFLKRSMENANNRRNDALAVLNSKGYDSLSNTEKSRVDFNFINGSEVLGDALIRYGVMNTYSNNKKVER